MDRFTPAQPGPPAPLPPAGTEPPPVAPVAPTAAAATDPEPAAAGRTVPGTAVAAPGSRRARSEARLRARVGDRPIVAWTRCWVSRECRLHRLLAARTLDVAVITDTELSLVTTGFLARRPRRRVYAAALGDLAVRDAGARRGRRLVVSSAGRDTLRLELSTSARAAAFAAALLASVEAAGS